MIRKSSVVEYMLDSFKNLESVWDQMQQPDHIFKIMFEVHKEYNSMLNLMHKKQLKNGLM